MKRSKAKTEAQVLMATYLEELGITFTEEWRFHEERRWRFDYSFCHRAQLVAIEIEGGGWIQGRHSRGAGFEGDLEKYATASSMGWMIFRFSPKMVLSGAAKDYIAKWLKLVPGVPGRYQMARIES